MINIILNKPDFHEAWAYESLMSILTPAMRVLIIPLLHDEGWAEDSTSFEQQYHYGSHFHQMITAPFHMYQIQDAHIQWFHPYKDTQSTLEKRLQNTDIIYLIGNEPDEMMECIEDHHLAEGLRQFKGIVMGNASGSKIMLDRFISDHEWQEDAVHGLGYLQGFSIETGYIEDVKHLSHIIQSIEQEGKAVFACPDQSGILIQDGHYELLGNAFISSDEDLDNLYHAYEDAKSRQDYYGDNGDW